MASSRRGKFTRPAARDSTRRWTALQENLAVARSSGTYLRDRAKLAKFDLIIFDEMGIRNFTATHSTPSGIDSNHALARPVNNVDNIKGILRGTSKL